LLIINIQAFQNHLVVCGDSKPTGLLLGIPVLIENYKSAKKHLL